MARLESTITITSQSTCAKPSSAAMVESAIQPHMEQVLVKGIDRLEVPVVLKIS